MAHKIDNCFYRTIEELKSALGKQPFTFTDRFYRTIEELKCHYNLSMLRMSRSFYRTIEELKFPFSAIFCFAAPFLSHH